MIIITNTTEYTEKVLAQKFNWQRPKIAEQPFLVSELSKKLFMDQKVFYFDTGLRSLWKYMFVVKHAQQSQFTMLIEVLKENTFSEGILCLAESGTNFKGYRKRKWESIPGNLHVSMFLNPNCPVHNFGTGFTILSTISVVQAMNQITEIKGKAAIKWVNDVYIEDYKISGVLTHTQTTGNNVTGVFLGIGINVESIPNVSNDTIVPKVSSLWHFTEEGKKYSQGMVLKHLLKQININYDLLLQNRYAELLDIYRKHSLVIGRNVKIYSDPFSGDPEFVIKGKVLLIGENLELYLENETNSVTKGRIVLI